MLSIVLHIIHFLGLILDKILDYSFSVLDSTKFSLWKKENLAEFHLLVRIHKNTIYPVFMSVSLKNLVVKEKGDLLTDSWYDREYVIREIVNKGYSPLIKP